MLVQDLVALQLGYKWGQKWVPKIGKSISHPKVGRSSPHPKSQEEEPAIPKLAGVSAGPELGGATPMPKMGRATSMPKEKERRKPHAKDSKSNLPSQSWENP